MYYHQRSCKSCSTEQYMIGRLLTNKLINYGPYIEPRGTPCIR